MGQMKIYIYIYISGYWPFSGAVRSYRWFRVFLPLVFSLRSVCLKGGEEGGSALIIPKGADVTVDGNCACLSRKANVRPFRFFHVKEDAACHLRNLRMENGMIVRAFGGAVLNEGLTTLQGCLLKGCSAQGADGGKPSLAPSWDGSEWPDLVPE